MDQRSQNVTLTKDLIVARHCDACATTTLHVSDTGETCLQCVVDSGFVQPDLRKYNRWVDEKGLVIPVARGTIIEP